MQFRLASGMVQAGCSFRESFRLNNERRYHDWKRPYGKDEAVPMREPDYGPLVQVGVLSCLEVFFVLRGYIARQGSTDAYGGDDELLHGFWGNQLNRGKLMPVSRRQSKDFIPAGIVHVRAGRSSSRIEIVRVWRNLRSRASELPKVCKGLELLDGWPMGSAR
jgi:hypothetical protein